MNSALLYGLTLEYQALVVKTGEVDLTKLRLADVERFVPGTTLEMDWESLIYIKNCRRTGQRLDTIVWTAKDGFFRTEITSGSLINQQLNAGTQNWHELGTIAKVLELSRPLPMVLGKTMAIKTSENKQGNHFSWLGVHAVSNVNQTFQENRVKILLHCGLSMVIADSVSRLGKKMGEAHQILGFQQERHAYASQQNMPSHSGYFPPREELKNFNFELYYSFALKLIRKSGYAITEQEAYDLTAEILQDKNQRLRHLDDELGA